MNERRVVEWVIFHWHVIGRGVDLSFEKTTGFHEFCVLKSLDSTSLFHIFVIEFFFQLLPHFNTCFRVRIPS